jgi:hypothetical protein
MELNFNVSKEERKALVKAIGELTGSAPVYLGAPGFKFAVGACVVGKDGVVVFDDRANTEDVRVLIDGLAKRGFVAEGGIEGNADCKDAADANNSELPEPCGVETDDGSGNLIVNMPLSGFTATAIDNLEKLVTAKSWIIRKMTGADELPIGRDEQYLRFPWFGKDTSPAEVDAYSRLVARLCETAKEKQRVTATERKLEDGDNEKFKARCFLLSLGFIGKEYAQARKILLAPMSGSGSHKAGDGKKTAHNGITAAGIGAETSEAIHDRGDFSGADGADNGVEAPLRCGECEHHVYYKEGQMLTNAGDIVDTSGRTPNSYTYYCLNAPSGYRKLKHAAEWSGSETAPKWCPLYAERGSVREECSDTHANFKAVDIGEVAV